MQWSDLVKNLDTLKSYVPIVTAVSGALFGISWLGYWNWRKRRRKREIPAGVSPLLVLPPGTKDVLRQLMGATEQSQNDPLADFNILYQQRQPDREIRRELETALKAHDWVLVLGQTGIGKTREVCHLAELWNGEGWQVIKLKDGGDTWLDEPKQLPSEINREQNVLFIIDDLNRWVRRGNPLEISPTAEDPLQPLRAALPDRLLRLLTFYHSELRAKVKVIATARNEPEEWAKLEIDNYPRFWQKFDRYSLPVPADNAIVSLLTERVEEAKMAGKPEDYPEIARKNDRTFRNIIENLRVAKNRQLTVENGQFAENLTQTWREKYSQAVKKYPSARYVYDAVELLQGLNLLLHPQLVRETARLISAERGFRKLKVWWQMGSVVEALSQQEGILQPRDGQIAGKSTPMLTVDTVAPQKILRLLVDVWADDPNEILVSELFDVGSALGKLGRLDEAIASFDKALEFKPDNDAAWHNRGTALGNLSRLDEAIASYEKALEFKPDNDAAWHNRGTALGNLSRLDEAIASFDKALEFKPDNDAAWHNRGSALGKLSRFDEAIASFDKALEFKPDNDAAWHNRGVALDNLGRFDEAIASFDKALEFKPEDDEAWYNRGIALGNLGRFDEAIASFDKALEFKPDKDAAWNNRGTTLGNLGRFDEAIASYARALQIQPQSSITIYNLACCHALQGNIDESINYLQQAIQIEPNEYINLALQDDDFRSIRNDPRFIALLNLGVSE